MIEATRTASDLIDVVIEQATNRLKHIWLELTEKCNLSCLHCYADSSPDRPLLGAMTPKDWLRVIGEAREIGADSLQFIGGEPLLYPYLADLLQASKRYGFDDVEVYTNATALTPDTACMLQAHGVRVAFSFYSSDPESHDRIVGRSGAFERTLRGIDAAVNSGLAMRAGIIKIDQSEAEIGSAKDLLESRFGITALSVDRARAIGRLATIADRSLNLGELCGACHDGRACVCSTGEVYPCIMARNAPLGNALEHDLATIFRGDARTRFVTNQLEYLERHAASRPCDPNSGNCGPANCSPNGGCPPSAP